MQGGRDGTGRGGPFGFGDPFSGFGGFGQPGSLMPSFFGGRDPFDHPFFQSPFGSMMRPPSMFRPSMFEPHGHGIGGMMNAGNLLEQAHEPSRPNGPIIKELSSDDEANADGNEDNDEKKKGNRRKHSRPSKEPCVEDPDEGIEEKRAKHDLSGSRYNRGSTSRLHPQTFMFQSSTITYGGSNGACYTSSTTRRTGGDGITLEESKEADTTTRKATHRISRGIHDKGHSVTRKLNSDGKVNTLQTLHNLNEGELFGFEESWRRNASEKLPGWDPRFDMLGNGSVRSNIRDEHQRRALPAPDQSHMSNSSRMKMLHSPHCSFKDPKQ